MDIHSNLTSKRSIFQAIKIMIIILVGCYLTTCQNEILFGSPSIHNVVSIHDKLFFLGDISLSNYHADIAVNHYSFIGIAGNELDSIEPLNIFIPDSTCFFVQVIGNSIYLLVSWTSEAPGKVRLFTSNDMGDTWNSVIIAVNNNQEVEGVPCEFEFSDEMNGYLITEQWTVSSAAEGTRGKMVKYTTPNAGAKWYQESINNGKDCFTKQKEIKYNGYNIQIGYNESYKYRYKKEQAKKWTTVDTIFIKKTGITKKNIKIFNWQNNSFEK